MTPSQDPISRLELGTPRHVEHFPDSDTRAPSGRSNPGRLGVLSELAGRLSEAPEAPDTLQAVVDGARRATAGDGVQLVLSDAGGSGPVAYASGPARVSDGGPRLEVSVRIGTLELGVMTLVRSSSREPFAEADLLFAKTLAGQLASALDASRLRRAEREAGPERRRVAQALSHEIRTPLATLRGFLSVLGKGPLTDDQRTFVEYASRNAGKLQELADDLVTLTRLETEPVGELDAVPLSEALRERLEAWNVPGTVSVPAGLAALIGHGRLVAALDALLSNAVEYSPPGAAVRLSAGEEGGRVVVSVYDAGSGVADDEREKIFERFVRGRAAAITGRPGHGLGLAVVQTVATQAGGRAWCEPVLGGGSCFKLSLPMP